LEIGDNDAVTTYSPFSSIVSASEKFDVDKPIKTTSVCKRIDIKIFLPRCPPHRIYDIKLGKQDGIRTEAKEFCICIKYLHSIPQRGLINIRPVSGLMRDKNIGLFAFPCFEIQHSGG
jgi:hypothetical protein